MPKNELFDTPKVEVELDDNEQDQESTEETSEARPEEEDEFEGGLCWSGR